jgi:hypothetical protein
MAKDKRIEEMTTDEVMESLFPKEAIEEADKLAGKTREKVLPDDPSDMPEE